MTNKEKKTQRQTINNLYEYYTKIYPSLKKEQCQRLVSQVVR